MCASEPESAYARPQRVPPVLHVEPCVLALVGKGGVGRQDAAFCRTDVVRCNREHERVSARSRGESR